MPRPDDILHMRRAIDLAMRGRGFVEPNPLVGCVIVKAGRVIGEGWHERFGGPHAEPNALANCSEAPAGATAYVTLEPCCHIAKKTPPCVPKLIDAKIARVVIGCLDPNPLVSGGGVEKLRAAGIEVEVGVLEAESRQLAAAFFATATQSRPYVTLKWAQTADEKIAGAGGTRLQISNARSTAAVHALRSRCDAILVGINTVLADDPLLTVRGVVPLRPLRRLVLDTCLRTPLASAVVRSIAQGEVVILCSEETFAREASRIRQLNDLGVTVSPLPKNHDKTLSLSKLIHGIRAAAPYHNAAHLLVEPGPTLAHSFIAAALVDRIWVFRSPARVDHATAPAAAEIPGHYQMSGEVDLQGDRLIEYLNPRSAVFFANEQSADLRSLQSSLQK